MSAHPRTPAATAVRRRARPFRGGASRGPRNVLFVEKTIGFGGSTVGLAQIVTRLDRDKFRPFVVVSHASQRDYLRARGVADDAIAVVPARIPRPVPQRSRFGLRARAARTLDSALGVLDGWRRDLPWARQVHRFAVQHDIELVHLNNSLSVNRGGILVADRLGVPCVVKQRCFEWHSWGVRRLLPHVAHFLPDSGALAADLARLGAPRDRILVTYCAVDPQALRVTEDPASIRASLGLTPGERTFGIVGQLLPWKGQRVFLDAAARVLRDVPSARALVVGAAPDGSDTPYAKELRRRAQELGIADRVLFTGHRSDVPRVLRALDVVVHASIQPEPFGTVVAEALASGRPVVAANAGGPPEYVEHGRTGLLARPGDDGDLASAIRRMLLDRELARQMAETGRRQVLARFSVDRHVALTQGVYEGVLAAAEAGG